METVLELVIAAVGFTVAGGYLGYRYGKAAQLKAQQVEQAAKVTVNKVL